MAQCTAKAKSTGERCRRRAVTGYTVCQVHGAGSPLQGRPGGRPIEARTGGRYSKYLPARLVSRFEEMTRDAELLAMRDDIALVDARIADLMARVDTGEAGKWWSEMRASYGALSDALRRKDNESIAIALRDLNVTINKGNSDYASWNEITGLLEQRRKLVESEQKRVLAAQHTLRLDEAARLMAALTSAVREHVTDPVTLGRIEQEFIRLSTLPDNSRVESTSRS